MSRTFKVEELESVVEEFLLSLENNRVLGFSGDLGAGKTTFTKALLNKMGHAGNAPSPTFVLRRDYQLPETKVIHKLIHIDAYRLEKLDQIFQVISKEELADKNNLIIIEWPEKAQLNIFDKIYKFSHISEVERKIEIV